MFNFLKNSNNSNLLKNQETIINFIFDSVDNYANKNELLPFMSSRFNQWENDLKERKKENNFQLWKHPFIIYNRVDQFLFLYNIFGEPNMNIRIKNNYDVNWICVKRFFMKKNTGSYEMLTIRKFNLKQSEDMIFAFQLGTTYNLYNYRHYDEELTQNDNNKSIFLIEAGFYK